MGAIVEVKEHKKEILPYLVKIYCEFGLASSSDTVISESKMTVSLCSYSISTHSQQKVKTITRKKVALFCSDRKNIDIPKC